MVWINLDTFDCLPHGVKWRPSNVTQWIEAKTWCESRIGLQCIDWVDSGAEMQLPTIWYFKIHEQAVEFQLVWT